MAPWEGRLARHAAVRRHLNCLDGVLQGQQHDHTGRPAQYIVNKVMPCLIILGVPGHIYHINSGQLRSSLELVKLVWNWG